MAKDYSSQGYVIVEKGDTLWAIASKYLGAGKKYTELAKINNLADPNKIRVGQKIYLNSSSASNDSSGTSTVTGTSSNMCSKVTVGLLASDSTTLYATWEWGQEAKTDYYKVAWYYTTIEGLEFVGNVTSVTSDDEYYAASKQSAFTIPSGAKQVKFRVRPVSKEVDADLLTTIKNAITKVVGVDTKNYYFDSEWTPWVTYTVGTPLDDVGVPSVELGDVFNKNGALYQKLTATLENVENVGTNVTHVQFQIAKDNTSILETTSDITINTTTNYVSYSRDVEVGHEYTVRARGVLKKLYSDWSAYSSAVIAAPVPPSGFTVCKAYSETAVWLEWEAVETAQSYDVQYTTDVNEFDNLTSLSTTNIPNKATQCLINNLETGKEYYFRIRSVNDGQPVSTSTWSEPTSVVIGTVPAAPTTWSSSETVVTDEMLTLYWVHNSKDGSSQTNAIVELYLNGEKLTSLTIENTTDEDEKDNTSSLVITTIKDVYDELDAQGRNAYLIIDDISDGATLEWRVCTRGVLASYSDWSIQRKVDIYAQPWVTLSLLDGVNGNAIDMLTKFPLIVYAVPGPQTQTPVGYHVTVTAHTLYDIADDTGNITAIGSDGLVYSKYFDVGTEIQVELSAHNIALKNNVTYTVTVSVAMNSGLTAESSSDFTVAWDEVEYVPNASLSIDQNTFMAYIRPYCSEGTLVNHVVSRDGDDYVVTDETFGYAYGERIPEVDADEYFWTKTVVAYSDNTSSINYGAGELGVSSTMGKTVSSTVITYQKSTDNTSIPAGEWLDAAPSLDDHEYLWSCSIDTFTDGETYTTYTVDPMGVLVPDISTITSISESYCKLPVNMSIDGAVWDTSLTYAKTTTGESVMQGANANGDELYFCEVEESTLITDVLLSVYRREFDGSFVEIAKDLDAALNITVTDPHPSLDFARYRIIATSKETGSVRYYDMPALPVNGKAAIIQWDEEWTNFDTTEGEFQVQPPWEGSLLKLPYNIDVTDNSKPDVELVNYIGRANPVSYYGTQTGKSATWNMVIPKSDKETLYAIRRLSNWMGDVYVREPSGSGYWANVTVSYSQKHKDVTIPITLTINRVEGGA